MQLHAGDGRAPSRCPPLRLRERLSSPARTPRCRRSSIAPARRRLGGRARVRNGAEERRLARRDRSSKRRGHDAYAVLLRRRMRPRSRRLPLRRQERLCRPARTARCRRSSVGEEPRSARPVQVPLRRARSRGCRAGGARLGCVAGYASPIRFKASSHCRFVVALRCRLGGLWHALPGRTLPDDVSECGGRTVERGLG